MLEIKGSRRRPVLRLVKRRSAQTLVPIIQKYVRRGTTILSDSWASYRHLAHYGYIHYQVTHNRHFVHPGTGAHTQHIERAWRSYKTDIYRYRGNMTMQTLKDNLSFIEWDQWRGKLHRKGRLGALFKDIRQMYKVWPTTVSISVVLGSQFQF